MSQQGPLSHEELRVNKMNTKDIATIRRVAWRIEELKDKNVTLPTIIEKIREAVRSRVPKETLLTEEYWREAFKS